MAKRLGQNERDVRNIRRVREREKSYGKWKDFYFWGSEATKAQTLTDPMSSG